MIHNEEEIAQLSSNQYPSRREATVDQNPPLKTKQRYPTEAYSRSEGNRRYLAPSEAGKYDNSNKISARKSYRANYQPHNKIILKTWIAGRNNIPLPSSHEGDDGLAPSWIYLLRDKG